MFFKHPPRQLTLPYSYGIDRAVLQALEKGPPASLGDVTRSAYALAYPPKEITPCLPQLVAKVQAKLDKLASTAETGTPKPRPRLKTLGSAYASWLAQLDAEASCLYLAGNDPDKAYHLYWFCEITFIEGALAQKIEQDSQASILQMEACMYGAGNRYSNDESNTQQFDLSSGEGLAELRKLGF